MPARARRLGIPLKAPTLPMRHGVGVRYWILDKKGRLGAPFAQGSHWSPGLNKGKGLQGTAAGLYCFDYKPGLSVTPYFDIDQARVTGPSFMPGTFAPVGGIAYWLPEGKPKAGEEVAAKYAAVACLVRPKKAGVKYSSHLERAADRYQVKIVDPSEIKEAVDEYVREHLPTFQVIPPRPLFDLTSQKFISVDPSSQRWDFIPRRHRARSQFAT